MCSEIENPLKYPVKPKIGNSGNNNQTIIKIKQASEVNNKDKIPKTPKNVRIIAPIILEIILSTKTLSASDNPLPLSFADICLKGAKKVLKIKVSEKKSTTLRILRVHSSSLSINPLVYHH